MKKNWKSVLFGFGLAFVVGVAFFIFMNYEYNNSATFRNFFSGASQDTVYGQVGEGGETLAMHQEMMGKVSMIIFTLITILQFVAFAVAWAVVSSIGSSEGSCELKLKRLDNAEIFFDIPLYVGLFGTISAFLVMTFSPQSSRLIAYSSTLIGIIFSLILRLSMQYPLKNKLIASGAKNGEEK